MSLTVVKTKANSGSSDERKKRKGKERKALDAQGTRVERWSPRHTAGARYRGVCLGARCCPKGSQCSEPSWSLVGRTDFSSRLHFGRRGEWDAAATPSPGARGTGGSHRGEFHGPHTSCGHRSPSPAPARVPNPQKIKTRAPRRDGQRLFLMREALHWVSWFN